MTTIVGKVKARFDLFYLRKTSKGRLAKRFTPMDAATLALFKETKGAVSVCEAQCIYNLALNAPMGAGATLGSHAGKDSIPTVSALAQLGYTKYFMVDPLYRDDKKFNQEVAERVSLASKRAIKPELMPVFSTEAMPDIVKREGKFGYIMVDSSDHAYDLLKEETDFLKTQMVPGGIMAFHDFGNYHDPLRIYSELIASNLFEGIHLDWSGIKSYVGDSEKGNVSWHAPNTKYPCFVGALRKL